MKKQLKIIALLLFVIPFINCKSSKMDKKEPFTLIKATYQNWYGGRKGIRGIKIEIYGANPQKDISYKNVYFKNKKASIETTLKDKELFLQANINTSTRDKMLNIHGDSQKEYGNKAPIKSKYPNLKENEAIIDYTQNGEDKIFKINLTKTKDLYYQ